MNKDCIVLHIPHSSLTIPEDALHQYDTNFLREELLLMTDRFTDELFGLPYTSIVFPYSRLFCDVERFRDDSREEMSQKGMGVVYTRTQFLYASKTLLPKSPETRVWKKPATSGHLLQKSSAKQSLKR